MISFFLHRNMNENRPCKIYEGWLQEDEKEICDSCNVILYRVSTNQEGF